MKFGAVALLVGLVACAPSYKARLDVAVGQARTAKTIAPVETPVSLPWKIGQWAVYATSDGGYQTIELYGEDRCGQWFNAKLVSQDGTVAWAVCVRPPHGPSTRPIDWVGEVIVFDKYGGRETSVDDLEHRDAFVAVVQSFFPASWSATSQREEVDVRAGHFVGAVRSDEPGGTRWTHPDVPFGSTVRFRTSAGGEFSLVAYGSRSSPLRQADFRPRYPLGLIGLGYEAGQISGHGAVERTSLGGPILELGLHVRSQLDLVLSEGFFDLHDSPQGLIVATFGPRWYPFAIARPRFARYGVEGLFVRAEAGYAELGASNEDRANGLAVHAGIGWLQQYAGWGISLDFGDRMMWFNQDAGLRHDLAFNIVLIGSP